MARVWLYVELNPWVFGFQLWNLWPCFTRFFDEYLCHACDGIIRGHIEYTNMCWISCLLFVCVDPRSKLVICPGVGVRVHGWPWLSYQNNPFCPFKFISNMKPKNPKTHPHKTIAGLGLVPTKNLLEPALVYNTDMNVHECTRASSPKCEGALLHIFWPMYIFIEFTT